VVGGQALGFSGQPSQGRRDREEAVGHVSSPRRMSRSDGNGQVKRITTDTSAAAASRTTWEKRPVRVLFFSPHCLIDPGSGAAVATLSLLQTLAEHGVACRGICAGKLDLPPGSSLRQLVCAGNDFDVSSRRVTVKGNVQGVELTLYDCVLRQQRSTLLQVLDTGNTAAGQWDDGSSQVFLACFAQSWRQLEPDVMVAYGGDRVAVEVYRLVRQLKRPVVFYLHNFAYRDRNFFSNVSRLVVPSQWAQEWYEREVGIRPAVLPYVVRPQRCLCSERRPVYVTFVNPLPAKGLAVFARVAEILSRERPDIRLLVVEARGRVDWLIRTGPDVRSLRSVDFLPNVPDPRHFLSRTRLMLVPSLWNESFGLVAAEAMLNGIPVVASRRGALPETVGHGGILIDVPPEIGENQVLAVPPDVARPWVDAIVRLWDEPDTYERYSIEAKTRAASWLPEAVVPRWVQFLKRLS
jgi:glycosyltransferase involved in cell wall biosynthesis